MTRCPGAEVGYRTQPLSLRVQISQKSFPWGSVSRIRVASAPEAYPHAHPLEVQLLELLQCNIATLHCRNDLPELLNVLLTLGCRAHRGGPVKN